MINRFSYNITTFITLIAMLRSTRSRTRKRANFSATTFNVQVHNYCTRKHVHPRNLANFVNFVHICQFSRAAGRSTASIGRRGLTGTTWTMQGPRPCPEAASDRTGTSRYMFTFCRSYFTFEEIFCTIFLAPQVFRTSSQFYPQSFS